MYLPEDRFHILPRSLIGFDLQGHLSHGINTEKTSGYLKTRHLTAQFPSIFGPYRSSDLNSSVIDMENNNHVNKEKGRHSEHRKTAVVVGIMFILATVTAILTMVNLGSILEPSELLHNLPANDTKVVISVILELILAFCVMGIGFFMFPVLKKHDEGLAAGYVVLRLAESMLIVIASVGLISLLTVSQEYSSGTWDSGAFEPLASILLAVREWSFIIGTMIFLGLGGLFLYYCTYRLRLVPRWLSAWGLIGAALVLIYGVISLFGYDPSILAAPIGLQEMVFAVWLIAKGFRSVPAVPSTKE
jgi:hypothetical protein